jgi:hypothetical protein
VDQVIQGALLISGERDTVHGVTKVPIKTRKNPKSMLTRQRSPSVGRALGYRDTSRLSAQRLALVERNARIPFGQFQRRRQPSDPTAEYRYPRTSRYCPSRCWDTHQSGCGGQTGQRPVPQKLPARPTCMHPILPHAPRSPHPTLSLGDTEVTYRCSRCGVGLQTR